MGKVSIGDFVIRGVSMRDVVRTFFFFFGIFSFISLLDILSIVHWSCDHLVIENFVLIFYIYLMMLLSHFTYLSICCFFSLFIHIFLI